MRMLAVALAMVAAGQLAAGQIRPETKAGVDAWERGDYRTAVESWRRAAQAGDADAQFNLGQAYKLGRGVPVDTQAAEGWYQKASVQGHVEAADNYGLALFQNGKPREAIPYLEKSVARGEPRAQYILGTMLFNGIDIKKDWVRAYALTSRATAAGLPQAAQAKQQMDGYLSAAERAQGTTLAQQMDGGGASGGLPGEIAGRGTSTAMRGVELPPSTVGQRPVVQRPAGLPPAPQPRDLAPVARPPVVAQQPGGGAGGRWRLQLGAFGDAGNARKLGGQVAGRFPGRSVDYVRAGSLTKVLVGRFASRGEAAAACGALKPCVPVSD